MVRYFSALVLVVCVFFTQPVQAGPEREPRPAGFTEWEQVPFVVSPARRDREFTPRSGFTEWEQVPFITGKARPVPAPATLLDTLLRWWWDGFSP